MSNLQSHTPPTRPRPLRAVDRIGRSLGQLGWRGIRIDIERLLATARRTARLEDFGDPAFLPGLRLLVESLEADARLSPFGRYVAKRQLLELLGHRLQLTAYRARHPEVAEQVIERPLLVVGLPRTGTTLLYELLAQDPAHRAPLSWELDDPCPATASPAASSPVPPSPTGASAAVSLAVSPISAMVNSDRRCKPWSSYCAWISQIVVGVSGISTV